MYCQNCGKELPEGMKFCIECGTKLETERIETVKNDSVNSVTFDSSATSDSIPDSQHISDIDGSENASVSDFQTQNDNSREDTNADLMHSNSKNDQITFGLNKTINNKSQNNQFFISSNGVINNKKSSVFSKISNLSFAFKIAVLSVLGLIIVASVIFIKINSSSINNDLVVKGENNTGAAFNLTLDQFNKKFKDYLIKNYNENCSLDISKLWEQPVQQTEEGSGVLYSSYSSKLMKQSEYINGVSLTANVADRHIIDFQISIDEYELDNAACYKCWQNLSFLTFGTCGNLSSGELTTIMSELNKNRNIAKTVLKDNIAYTFFYNKEDECYVFQAFPVTNKYKKTYENEFLDFKKLDKIESSDEKTTTQEIDVFKNIDIDVDGSNGYATAQLSFPYDYNVDFGGVRFSEYNNSYDSVNVYFGDEEIGFVLL